MTNDYAHKYLESPYYNKIIDSHRGWLDGFRANYLDKWENMFANNNPEAAICEAATRQMLIEQNIKVEPFDLESNRPSPDFKCLKDGLLFYIEATCITKEVVTEKTRLNGEKENRGTTHYGGLTQAIFNEACSKTRQCSNLGAPCLLCIGTLHVSGCQCCFDEYTIEEILTSTPFIEGLINDGTGGLVGEAYEVTDLQSSAFIRFGRKESDYIEAARSPISAILLNPVGCSTMPALGALHPNPNHPFERNILKEIRFCRLKEGWRGGNFRVEWI